jgi:hypothetical protein
MISTSGRYWSTGITVTEYIGRWTASLDYCDDGFADDDPDAELISTQGSLSTRYGVRDGDTRSGLTAAVDALVADAKKLGIEFIATSGTDAPFLYYKGDGEWEDFPPPNGWRETLAAEAARIGFASYTTRFANKES